MRLDLKFRRLHPEAILPTKAHDGDLGWDLYALHNVNIPPASNILVPTGIACQFPDGVGAILKDRSSISSNKRVYVKAGIIDNAFRGEIKVLLENPNHTSHSSEYCVLGDDNGSKYFMRGERIAQMILVPIIDCDAMEVDFLDDTIRGVNGFGSSGS